MRSRRRRVRGRIVTAPSGVARAWVGPDGRLTLPSGYTYRIGFTSSGRRPAIVPGGEPPAVRWRESRGRTALTSTVFASKKGIFLKLEVANPFGEARSITLEVAVEGGDPPSALEISGDGLVTCASGRPLRLLDVAGARLSGEYPRRRGRRGGLTVEIVVPPRGKRAFTCVLEPEGRTRARSLHRAYAEAIASWDRVRDSLAACRLPDETLAAAFDRARYALVGSISGGDSRPWPRPGVRPQAGPATMDALALRALDQWGGGRLVENCLRWVLDAQRGAALPSPVGATTSLRAKGASAGGALPGRSGDSFRIGPEVHVRGFLTLPPEEEARERWGSDCGALLWATCARTDVGVTKSYLRSVRRGVEEACAWIAGELGRDGLLLKLRGPRRSPFAEDRSPWRDARAWNDAWSWRGLDAAARMLEGLGGRLPPHRRASGAAGIRAVAEGYRDAILRAYSDSPGGRECLQRLGVVTGRASSRPAEEKLHAQRLRLLYGWAEDLAGASLTAEGELRAAAFFLETLRGLLVREEESGGGRAGALHVFPGAPPTWVGEDSRLEIERMPTSAGVVSASAMEAPGGGRLLLELELPRGAPETALHLGGRRLRDVRVNGRRRRAREARRSARGSGRRGGGPGSGIVWLPAGGGFFDVSAEIVGESLSRRSGPRHGADVPARRSKGRGGSPRRRRPK